MNFLEYKNYLQEHNINLFDFDYRNSYDNILTILNDINNKDKKLNYQIGGSNIFYISPFTIIKRTSKNNKNEAKKLNFLINNLVSNNLNGAKYLCQKDLIIRV